ncbi:transcription factor bHLH93 [Glycine max]|uniref:transcription factor bHLH93 n=1 Tax=Glycine max TaxID=3847 RepID=UPI0003DED104|nr:transcription factor bHLH93 [Glycine max]|eukprot:XP_006603405.1 transcription factor bHLH93 [Glycine max]
MARIGKGSVEFEDLLPVITGKLGGEGLIKELCKGFRVDPSTHVAVGVDPSTHLYLICCVECISHMDRTSILGDTIDYMKELLEKINNLRQEVEVDSNMAGIFKDVKPNEILVRNSPKFEVERSVDTRVEICCVGKPGLILSTVNTLKALGLEIQQCVISCFNDFTMQASCSEESEQRTMLSFEDIKQALFRSAGYGGRCL